MTRIEMKFFGKPQIIIDGDIATVSLKRSEAMLYYIVYQKRVTREELVRLIWSDVEPQTAKKNLRNSLYRIKKDLGVELFVSLGKTVIITNPELEFILDAECEDLDFLKCYQGHFLRDFAVKDAEYFENWRIEVEQSLNHKHRIVGEKTVQNMIETGDLENALQIALIMRKIDAFDESVVRHLMEIYHLKQNYKQIVETYSSLKALLEDEMGISPDRLTRDLYYKLIQIRTDDEPDADGLYGRVGELASISKAIKVFGREFGNRAIIIEGEAGIGKTKLLNEALLKVDSQLVIYRTNCYMAEELFAYKAWNDIICRLVERYRFYKLDLPSGVLELMSKVFPGVMPFGISPHIENVEMIRSDYLEKVVCKLIGDLSMREPLILVFDDLQWMDESSLNLLLAVMLHVDRIAFMGTRRKNPSDVLERFVHQLEKYNLLLTIPLERFSKEETYEFVDYISKGSISSEQKEKIFESSEGNAFFIQEYTGLFHRNDSGALMRLKNLLDARLGELSADGLKVLGIIAMFFDAIDFQMLMDLYSKSQAQLLETIEELRSKDFVVEDETDAGLKISFTHNKLREHVYEKTALVTRRILHNRIAEILEQQLRNDSRDVLIYQKLIYHYECARNYKKQLRYTISYLKTYFDFSHELYPELITVGEISLEKSPEHYFELLEELFRHAEYEDVTDLRMKFLHMKSRYLIRQGNYDPGLVALEELIELCRQTFDEELLFKAYVQKMYYAIQTEHVSDMAALLEQMSGLKKSDKHEAMMERFRGIEKLMSGEYEKARTYFFSSIEKFKLMDKEHRYVLNIAAAYNYISETYRKEYSFELALGFVKEAIGLCNRYNILRGSSVFNTNAGIIAYGLGLLDDAKHYFKEALKYYDALDSLWRRSEAEGYLGIIEIETGNDAEGWKLIKMAKAHANQMHTPETIELLEKLENRALNGYYGNNLD